MEGGEGKKKEKARDRQTERQREQLLLGKLDCGHATDGLWEFCCTMMTVALARSEQLELKTTHYTCV